jgi:hypothetical protein
MPTYRDTAYFLLPCFRKSIGCVKDKLLGIVQCWSQFGWLSGLLSQGLQRMAPDFGPSN